MSDVRDVFQQKAVTEFTKLKVKKGTALCGTGIGKSKIAIDIIKKLKPKNILILVDSERNRDVTWQENFQKFDAMDWYFQTTIECYQAAYKFNKKKYDLVIADEFDFALTEEFSKFFLNNTYKSLLALTGFIDPKKQELCDQIAPVFITYSTTEAQKDNLLNKSKLNLYRFPLSLKKNIEIKYKKGGKDKSFFQSENDSYQYYEKRVKDAMIMLSTAQRATAVTASERENQLKQIEKFEAFHALATRKRKDFLSKLESSRELAKKLSNRILLADSQNKVIVFSSLTSQIDQICKYTYHSKNKVKKNIEMLNKGTIRELGVCQAIDRGENLDNVNFAIMESYTGSQTRFQQKHGRFTRLDVNEESTLCILVPYYFDKGVYKPTQSETWMNRMIKDFEVPVALDHKLFKQ